MNSVFTDVTFLQVTRMRSHIGECYFYITQM